MAKPAGVFRLTEENWGEVMGGLPVDSLWGIGTKTGRKLNELGIRTVTQLASANEGVLARAFGPNTGPWLRILAHGEDRSPVSAERYVPRSRGRETTFQEDIEDPKEARSQVLRLAREVAEDVAKEGRPAVRVVVKVRFKPFTTRTRGVSLEEPTTDPEAIGRGALAALGRFELDRPVRLLGVKAELVPPDSPSIS